MTRSDQLEITELEPTVLSGNNLILQTDLTDTASVPIVDKLFEFPVNFLRILPIFESTLEKLKKGEILTPDELGTIKTFAQMVVRFADEGIATIYSSRSKNYSRLYGLISHDLGGVFTGLSLPLEMYLRKVTKGQNNKEESLLTISSETLEALATFFKILQNLNEKPTSDQLSLTLKGKSAEKNVFILNNEETNEECVVDLDFYEFDSIESFFKVRTLIFNAFKANARKIKIIKRDSNPAIISYEVHDDIDEDKAELGSYQTFTKKVGEVYEQALLQPFNHVDKTQRGGEITALLSGQEIGQVINIVKNWIKQIRDRISNPAYPNKVELRSQLELLNQQYTKYSSLALSVDSSNGFIFYGVSTIKGFNKLIGFRTFTEA